MYTIANWVGGFHVSVYLLATIGWQVDRRGAGEVHVPKGQTHIIVMIVLVLAMSFTECH